MFMDAQAQAEELIQLVTQSMHGMAQERAEQVTRGEGAMLRYLATQHDGATAGELREALEVGSGRVSNALKNLEGKGMIMRVSSARDGRVVQVYLTEQGESRNHSQVSTSSPAGERAAGGRGREGHR
ncbi:MAG: winged helix DNA-binding protein [Clostridiales bacterium]|nr:winged helix DNA-binding protein [Clostridiales bacterium]